MRLLELHCDGFRSLRDVRFAPENGLNVIRGQNAQGKTSLLEAILYLATSKSHRAAAETELVRHGAEGFHIKGRVARRDREVTLEVHWWQGVKRIKVNDVAQERVSDILGKMNVVFFSPDDVSLVRGAASARRRFLDMELAQLNAAYLRALQQYRQALRQRNALLRAARCDRGLVSMWDEQLGKHGRVLVEERDSFLSQLSAQAQLAYERIAQKEALALRYRPDVKLETPLEEALAISFESDRKQGQTARGPHRDDFRLEIAGQSARVFASQGQQKTAALAIKLAEGVLVLERTGEYPVFMLDDVLSELDAERARRLVDSLPAECQCLLTTTDLNTHEGLLGHGCTYFRIAGGNLARD